MSKRKYGAWTEDDMHRALISFRNGDMGFNDCCRTYNIPKPTFNRHLKETNISANGEAKIIGKQTTLPEDVEKALLDHILLLESLMFGLTITDVRKLAFQIAEQNHIPHNFNKQTQLAGKKWYYAFKARHPELSLREPSATSLARVKGFNKGNVHGFFDILEKLVDENQIDATQIFNVDESGLCIVQNKCQKVLGLKGKKQIGSVSSGERGVNTSFVACTSASGNFVSPMLIFKRMRMANELKVDAPPGSLVEISETGYITSELFLKWLRNFIEIVKPTIDKKVILVLDGHTTHSKNLEAIVMAREYGVIMLQLPGHTTHRLQPLDKSFFSPLKSNFNQAIQKWLRSNPGLCVTQYQVAGLCTEAYSKAATIENAINGFRVTGVWPVDRSVFKDCDFAAAENLIQLCMHTDPESSKKEANNLISQPEISNLDHSATEMMADHDNSQHSASKKLSVSIETLSPIPKPKSKSKSGNVGQKASILTSSPYKRQLELLKELKLTQEKVKALKEKLGRPTSMKVCIKKEKSIEKKVNNVKKNLRFSGKSAKVASGSLVNDASSSNQSAAMVQVQPEEWYCFLCETNLVEDMIQCQICNLWVHDSCAGIANKDRPQKFTCVKCK